MFQHITLCISTSQAIFASIVSVFQFMPPKNYFDLLSSNTFDRFSSADGTSAEKRKLDTSTKIIFLSEFGKGRREKAYFRTRMFLLLLLDL